MVVIPWLALIDQTFRDFYLYKMFGYDDQNGNVYNPHNTSCVIVRSGDEVKCDPTIVKPFQSLVVDQIVGKIQSDINLGKKVVMLITRDSYVDKYFPDNNSEHYNNGILDKLFALGIKKEQIIEIVDEYHNLIPTSGLRKKHLQRADFLMTYSDRNSGILFYSASNKKGEIVSSDNTEQFGPLLCRVTREDLRKRGYVAQKLIFKLLVVNPLTLSADAKRNAIRKGLNIDKAQSEAAGVITAYNDLTNYVTEPNLITFGDHVAGCRQIAEDEEVNALLPDVKMHFMYSDTKPGEREEIIQSIKESGNNILNQHSVAKEGVNIQNLHGSIIDRGMDAKTSQQAIGRSDRALLEDTLRFEKGELSLDNPTGWKKYYNVIYCIVDNDDLSKAARLRDIVRYLLTNGIPKDKWDISAIDDEQKGGVDPYQPDPDAKLPSDCSFDNTKLRKMIDDAVVYVQEELKQENQNIISFEDVREELAQIEENEKNLEEALSLAKLSEIES